MVRKGSISRVTLDLRDQEGEPPQLGQTLGLAARRAGAYPLRQWARVIANAVQARITAVGAQTAYITPGSPWENGYIESFNARLRDEFLNGEIFYTLQETQILIKAGRRQYNTILPHSSLGYRPPAPKVLIWPATQPESNDPALYKLTAVQIHRINYIGSGPVIAGLPSTYPPRATLGQHTSKSRILQPMLPTNLACREVAF